MRYSIIGSLVLVLLVGCGSTTKDQTTGSDDQNQASASSQGGSQAQTSPNNQRVPKGSAISSQDPFIDPNNPLSQRSLYYDFDSYQVKDQYKNLVQAHAKYLSDHRSAKVLIQGNCDERGSREYNLALGQRRAESVKRMLSILGVQENQVEAVSLGEEKPRALGHDESAWAENRRSDLLYQSR